MRIEIGVTHQIQINGDNAWVKLSVEDEVSQSVELSDAVSALSDKVNKEIIKVIENTVETVNEYMEGK